MVRETAEQDERMLTEVFGRLAKASLRVQANKCELFEESLEFLGHCIDKCGIYTSQAKVEAIHKAPARTNKKELQALLGIVNFYNILWGRSEIAEKRFTICLMTMLPRNERRAPTSVRRPKEIVSIAVLARAFYGRRTQRRSFLRDSI